jgi:hypothetical protein
MLIIVMPNAVMLSVVALSYCKSVRHFVLLYNGLERLARDKHSSLLDSFVSYDENDVL